MATDPRTYQVEGSLIRETEKAVLIAIDKINDDNLEPPKSYWFPKTQVIDYVSSDQPETMDKFTIKHWIMDQHGLV